MQPPARLPTLPAQLLCFLLLSGNYGLAQGLALTGTTEGHSAMATAAPALPAAHPPFSSTGLAARIGMGGIGFDAATVLSRRFNVRAGADFFGYSTTFQEQGANIHANLLLRTGHASLDWFPLHGRLRLSPMVVFANNNRARATAIIPAGNTVTLNGQDYISSLTDPLHGSGAVDFRKVSPGFALGTGNIVRPGKGHLSFPVEVGFYYVGQPGLKVTFTGSACDPSLPASIGCEPVDQDTGFQKNLAAFIARSNHNLSYASYFPIVSAGFGYSF